jgi:hypothetical protein
MSSTYSPRLSVDLPEDLYFRFINAIPWGLRSKIMIVLLEDLLNLIDEHGSIVIPAVLERAIKVQQVVKGLNKNGT